MLNNNHHNKHCGFAEQMVAYLYEEIEPENKVGFEKHLDRCTACAEELAAFGFVRSSISDWRESEFLTLDTPEFEIPERVSDGFAKPVTVSGQAGSWLDGFIKIFSFAPGRAVVAVASLVIFVGITMVLFTSFENEVAVNPDSKTPLAEPLQVLENPPAENNSVEERVLETNDAPVEVAPAPVVEPTKPKTVRTRPTGARIERAAKPRLKKRENIKENPKPKETSIAGQNLTPRKQQIPPVENLEVPKLSDFEIEEDDSLRLSDLFDEVGSD